MTEGACGHHYLCMVRADPDAHPTKLVYTPYGTVPPTELIYTPGGLAVVESLLSVLGGS